MIARTVLLSVLMLGFVGAALAQKHARTQPADSRLGLSPSAVLPYRVQLLREEAAVALTEAELAELVEGVLLRARRQPLQVRSAESDSVDHMLVRVFFGPDGRYHREVRWISEAALQPSEPGFDPAVLYGCPTGGGGTTRNVALIGLEIADEVRYFLTRHRPGRPCREATDPVF